MSVNALCHGVDKLILLLLNNIIIIIDLLHPQLAQSIHLDSALKTGVTFVSLPTLSLWDVGHPSWHPLPCFWGNINFTSGGWVGPCCTMSPSFSFLSTFLQLSIHRDSECRYTFFNSVTRLIIIILWVPLQVDVNSNSHTPSKRCTVVEKTRLDLP